LTPDIEVSTISCITDIVVLTYRMPTISKFLDYDIVVSAISVTTISVVKTMISMVNTGILYRSFLVTYDIRVVGRSCQYWYIRIS
jgi:hypothetical protein